SPPGRRAGVPQGAGPRGDGAKAVGLHVAHQRGAARRRTRRTRGVSPRHSRQRTQQDSRRPVAREPVLHSLRGLPQRLPDLSQYWLDQAVARQAWRLDEAARLSRARTRAVSRLVEQGGEVVSREAFLSRVREAARAGRAYRVDLEEIPPGTSYVGVAGDLCSAL